MVFDCFTFYQELELLEVRLNILNEVVDKFVLIESTVTYTNQKKPLYFEKNKKRYKKFADKIIHVVVNDTPNVSNPWFIEHYLMAAAQKGLKDAKPTDTILVSNLDEIPSPEKIKEWKNKPGKLKVFEQRFFYYYLNFASITHNWVGTKMTSYKNFQTYMDAYIIRHSPNDVVIEDGGWHFSYMGGLKRIIDKIATGTHQEYNNTNYNTKEKIMRSIIERRDVFGHGDKFEYVPINLLPIYIQENQNKYKSMLLQKPKKVPFENQYIQYLEVKHSLRLLYRKLRGNVEKRSKSNPRSKNIVTCGEVDR